VTTEEGQTFNGFLFMETSAKMAFKVEEALLKTADKIYNKIKNGDIDISNEHPWY
jgi:hypothetical protein